MVSKKVLNKTALPVLLIILFFSACSDKKEKVKEFLFVSSPKGLNLRSEPDAKSKKITVLPFAGKVKVLKSKGEKIFFAGRYGKWVNVDYSGKKGWVFSGFLSTFDTGKIQHTVAEFYRKKHRKEYKDEYKKFLKGKKVTYEGLFTFKDNDIKVISIVKNVIKLEVPASGDSTWPNHIRPVISVGVYNGKNSSYVEYLFNDGTSQGTDGEIVHLNNDEFPDVLATYYTDGESSYYVLLGTQNGLIEQKNSIECDNAYQEAYDKFYKKYPNSFGKCGKTRIMCPKVYENKVLLYKFDCSTNSFKKYREIKVKKSKNK